MYLGQKSDATHVASTYYTRRLREGELGETYALSRKMVANAPRPL